MEIIIRPIVTEDKEKIEALFLLQNLKLSWDFSKFLNDENCFGLVLVEKDAVIGFGALLRYHSPLYGIIGRLEDIFIDPAYQGQGCGKKLINKLICLGRRLKLKQIVLTSNPKRVVARHIYTSAGFTPYETGVFVKILEA